MSEFTKIGTRVLITPCSGKNRGQNVFGTFKGYFPCGIFENLVPWVMTDDGEGFPGYDCYWGEVTPAEETAIDEIQEVAAALNERANGGMLFL